MSDVETVSSQCRPEKTVDTEYDIYRRKQAERLDVAGLSLRLVVGSFVASFLNPRGMGRNGLRNLFEYFLCMLCRRVVLVWRFLRD